MKNNLLTLGNTNKTFDLYLIPEVMASRADVGLSLAKQMLTLLIEVVEL